MQKPMRCIQIDDVGETEEKKEEISIATQVTVGRGESTLVSSGSTRTEQSTMPLAEAKSSPLICEVSTPGDTTLKSENEQSNEDLCVDISGPGLPFQTNGRSHETAAESSSRPTEPKSDQKAVSEKNTQAETVTEPSVGMLSLPSVPGSSIQFQSDWKKLRRDQLALSQYFKVGCTGRFTY